MTTLWLAVANADETTRARAVDALHDVGIEVSRAWIDQRPTSDAPVSVRRDPVGATLAVGMLALGGGLAAWWFAEGGWWILAALPAALLALLGAVGVAASLQKKDRTRPRART